MTKYKAKSFYLNISNNQILEPQKVKDSTKEFKKNLIFFASKHEYAVYSMLQGLPGNYIIELQPDIPIIPPNKISCYPKGKTWKVDFIVRQNDEIKMLVEAKGVMTKDFMLTLALLELNQPELFDKLWLIFPTRLPQSLLIKRLLTTPMKQRLLTKMQLQKSLKLMST